MRLFATLNKIQSIPSHSLHNKHSDPSASVNVRHKDTRAYRSKLSVRNMPTSVHYIELFWLVEWRECSGCVGCFQDLSASVGGELFAATRITRARKQKGNFAITYLSGACVVFLLSVVRLGCATVIRRVTSASAAPASPGRTARRSTRVRRVRAQTTASVWICRRVTRATLTSACAHTVSYSTSSSLRLFFYLGLQTRLCWLNWLCMLFYCLTKIEQITQFVFSLRLYFSNRS